MPRVGSSRVQNLPPGGTQGQQLAKKTSADYDVNWVTSSLVTDMPGHNAYILTGHWFDARSVPLSTAASYTPAFAANTTLYVPFYNRTPVTVDYLQIYLSLAASSSFNCAFNAVTATGQPGALLGSVVGLSTAVGGYSTAPASFSLPQGWVFASMGTTTAMVANTLNGIPPQAIRQMIQNTGIPTSGTSTGPVAWLDSTNGSPVSNPSGAWQADLIGFPMLWWRIA